MKYLLKGDISGIQDFIFNVSSKGAAKTLKSRSYYVTLVQKLGAKLIEKEFENCDLAKDVDFKCIYNSGGNFFYQIEKNDFDIESFVKASQKKIDEELRFDELYLCLTHSEVIDNFGNSWDNLKTEANRNKLKPYQYSFNSLFEPFDFHGVQKEKEGARWVTVVNNIYDSLPNGRWIQSANEMTKSREIRTGLFGCSIQQIFEKDSIISHLPTWSEDAINLSPKLVAKLSKDNDLEYRSPKKGNIIDFSYLAGFSEVRTGTNKIGILKMDVDSLGNHFKNKKTSDQLVELSNQLSCFFDQEVYKLWENGTNDFNEEISYKENIYPVFTGGDDCFFIGGWDAILLFAKYLNNAFKQYEFDQSLTLSAGIIIVAPTFPVVRFSEVAEQALAMAKSKEGKNSISIFNEVFSWEEFDDILSISKTLQELILENGESRALLERIKKSAIGYYALEQQVLNNKMSYPKIWRLKYYLRNAKNDENRKKIDEEIFSKYSTSLIDTFMNKAKTNVMKFPAAARIAEFLTRKKKGR